MSGVSWSIFVAANLSRRGIGPRLVVQVPLPRPLNGQAIGMKGCCVNPREPSDDRVTPIQTIHQKTVHAFEPFL